MLNPGGYEAGLIWQFLDGVSTAVSSRMTGGSSPGEENLTFLLCELLDANTTSLHALKYSLAQLRTDLEVGDSGLTVDVDFETHEHSKYVESRFSGADLGIVLSVDHPLLGCSRRGLLVQAKRLLGNGKTREFGLFADYRHFDRKQAEFLDAVRKRFGVHNSVFYLWYNPPSTAFPDADAKILRAYDACGLVGSRHLHRMHPFLDEMFEMGLAPWPVLSGSRARMSVDHEAEQRRWRQTQPALRISELDHVLRLTGLGRPALKALYDAAIEHRSWPVFAPFADFLLLALASSRYGSDDQDWVRLVEGQKVRMPASKSPSENDARIDEIEVPPTPHHTLRVSVRSTLPQVG